MPKNLYSQKYTTVKLNAVPDKAESTSEQRCHTIQNIVPTFHYIGNEVIIIIIIIIMFIPEDVQVRQFI